MIAVALQKGAFVNVYNEKNATILSLAGELVGYTGATVSIKRGTFVYTYNEKGVIISSRSTI